MCTSPKRQNHRKFAILNKFKWKYHSGCQNDGSVNVYYHLRFSVCFLRIFLSTRISLHRVFLILLISLSPQLHSNLLVLCKFRRRPVHHDLRSLTRREQQIQYSKTGRIPTRIRIRKHMSWKEERLCISGNYVRIEGVCNSFSIILVSSLLCVPFRCTFFSLLATIWLSHLNFKPIILVDCSDWIRSHSRLDANHVLNPLLPPALLRHRVSSNPFQRQFSCPAWTTLPPPLRAFQFAFFLRLSRPEPSFEANWSNGSAVVIIFSRSFILLCLFVHWNYLHWSPD